MPKQYTDDELLAQLRKCKQIHGSCSPQTFDGDDDFVSSSTVMRRFGGWTDAKTLAGIDEDLSSETGRSKVYENDEILEDLRTCQERRGKVTTETLRDEDDLVSPTTVVERFDNWLEAKKKAGIDADERVNNAKPQHYTDEELLDQLRECKEKHGKVTQRVFNNDAVFASAGALRKRFGSWSEAKKEAGLETYSGRYTDDELLDQLRKCKERHGRCTTDIFDADDDFSAPETVQRRFGKWSIAKEKAGVT